MIKTEKDNYKNNQTYFISTILAILIWSTSFIGTKIAYTSFSPITLGAARFIIASIVLGLAFIIKKDHTRLHLKDLGMISISGVLGITLYFTMENIGVKLTTASNAALIVASYPAITALLELFIFKTKPSRNKMLGILLAMAGVYILLNVNSDASSKNQLIGCIILIATGVVWAFYNFSTRMMVNKYPAITLSFYQTAAGTIFFIPLAFIERKQWQLPTGSSLLTLLYLGVLCSVIAFLFYNFGLRKLSSSSAVSLMNLVPIFSVIFSVLILHETVSIRQLIGGVIIIGGVMLSIKQEKIKTQVQLSSDRSQSN